MIALLGRVVRFLLIVLIVRLVLRGLAAAFRPKPMAAPVREGELVRDRICNTFLPRERAIHVLRSGREEHFCSPACRDRAEAALSA